MNKNYLISLMRVIAMTMIIICHFGTEYDNSAVGQLFQVGVQIFLLLSGLLYGDREIKSRGQWISRRLMRVSIPSIIHLIMMIIISLILGNRISNLMVMLTVFNLQGYKHVFTFLPDIEKIPGMAHLWFLTVIIICYVILVIIPKNHIKSLIPKRRRILVIFGIICLIAGGCGFRIDYFWIFIYGCLMYEKKQENITTKETVIAIILGVVAVMLRLVGKVLADNFGDTNLYLYMIIPASYNMLAISIFNIVRWIYKYTSRFILNSQWVKDIILSLDELSFYVYITHYVFIDGPIKMTRITDYNALNCLFVILVTFIASVILKGLTVCISKLLTKELSKGTV